MSAEIVFLSPFRGFTKLVNEVCHQAGETWIEVVETGAECSALARDLAIEGCKALIGKEFWATRLLGKVDLPIIALHVDAYTVLHSMFLASRTYRRVAYIGFMKEASRYDFQTFEEILGIEVKVFPYESEDDLSLLITRSIEAECEVILTTGACVARDAKNLNMPARVIYPGKEAILEAISRAKEIIAIRERDARYNQRLFTVINSVSDGIIMLDTENQIKIMNTMARQMFGNDSLGLPPEVFKKGLHNSSQLIQAGDSRLLMTRQPVSISEQETGTLITLKDVSEVQKLEQQIRREMVKKGLAAKFTFEDLIGDSPAFRRTVEKARRYAESDSTVLIIGESGTGKELFAQSIHNASNRRNGPFVGINCAALPESLLDSELFGYERGSFTGAEKTGKAGLFELAHNGTIFLDEIADLPFSLQAKLLRVLQEKEVRRIGGDKIIPINLRVIAATNKDLGQEVKEGRFRSDLYYRLNVLRLNIPPLRSRKEDIEPLAVYFLNRQTLKGRQHVPELSQEMLGKLKSYSWPGNGRELENFIERYVLFAGCDQYLETELREWQQPAGNQPSHDPLVNATPDVAGPGYIVVHKGTMVEMERQIIDTLLQETDGNKNRVSQILGISRTTLWKKLKQRDFEFIN